MIAIRQHLTKTARFWSYTLLFIIIVSLWLILLVALQYPDTLGTDFYPLYYAAHLLRAGENPYGAAATNHLIVTWPVPFAQAGIAYPLPAILSFWLVLLLPLPIGMWVWVSSGAVGAWFVIRLREDWAQLLLLPCCFMPLHRAILLKQATLIWFACIVVLLFAMRDRRAWLVGWCIAVLPAKPQTGLLFALAGLVWAIREHRRALLWAVLWVGIIWGGSFVLQPGWVGEWLASVRRYNQIVLTASLWPLGLVIIPLTWRLPWYARLSVAQVVLFPLSDIYSVLPLLLVWVAIGGPLALVGSGISWLWVFLDLPNTITFVWLILLVPLIGALGWRFAQSIVAQRRKTTQSG